MHSRTWVLRGQTGLCSVAQPQSRILRRLLQSPPSFGSRGVAECGILVAIGRYSKATRNIGFSGFCRVHTQICREFQLLLVRNEQLAIKVTCHAGALFFALHEDQSLTPTCAQ